MISAGTYHVRHSNRAVAIHPQREDASDPEDAREARQREEAAQVDSRLQERTGRVETVALHGVESSSPLGAAVWSHQCAATSVRLTLASGNIPGGCPQERTCGTGQGLGLGDISRITLGIAPSMR